MKDEYSILIGGQAGQGTRKAGLIIGKIFSKMGWRVFISEDYQSLIRGGHNFSQIRIAKKKIFAPKKEIDFLLALDEKTINLHYKNLKSDGLLVFNKDKISDKKFKGIGIPASSIVNEEKGDQIMENSSFLGAFAKLGGIDFKILEDVLKQEYKNSFDLNLKIAKKTYESVSVFKKIKKIGEKNFSLYTGNQLVGLGAKKAGLEFYLSYPMTPATSILQFLAQRKDLNIKTIQPENELAVINMALGIASAGKRVMVGTSGGGFALMTEAMSLASQAEIPIAVVLSQRTGPSTGVPTYTGQSDLLFAIHSGHGDIFHLVLAPSFDEVYFWAGEILNLAWKYQNPSLLLIDKEISESTISIDFEKMKSADYKPPLFGQGDQKDYKRYKDTNDGISPLLFFGQSTIVKINSYTHDEFGITVEESQQVKKATQKRLKKFQKMKKDLENYKGAIKIYGNKKSKRAIFCWGSSAGPLIELAESLDLKIIQPIIIQPFPEKQVKEALRGVKETILVETSAWGQLEKVLNSHFIKVDKKILKYDGRPFFVEEVTNLVKQNI